VRIYGIDGRSAELLLTTFDGRGRGVELPPEFAHALIVLGKNMKYGIGMIGLEIPITCPPYRVKVSRRHWNAVRSALLAVGAIETGGPLVPTRVLFRGPAMQLFYKSALWRSWDIGLSLELGDKRPEGVHVVNSALNGLVNPVKVDMPKAHAL
jgi:hypothetical protein